VEIFEEKEIASYQSYDQTIQGIVDTNCEEKCKEDGYYPTWVELFFANCPKRLGDVLEWCQRGWVLPNDYFFVPIY